MTKCGADYDNKYGATFFKCPFFLEFLISPNPFIILYFVDVRPNMTNTVGPNF